MSKAEKAGWRSEYSACVLEPERLGLSTRLTRAMERVVEKYPMRISPHVLSLVDFSNPRCPVRRQVVPDLRELDAGGELDPLAEEPRFVQPGVIRRFPDRLLALVSADCPTFCRHCNRKRYWKTGTATAGPDDIGRALGKLRGIREVILSGGEPLLKSDRALDRLLVAARSCLGVELLRIHTRAPFSMPSRISDGLLNTLRRHRPLWVLTQINHARELSVQTCSALASLVRAGIPVLNQAVLLRGVNDSLAAQVALGRSLVAIGVKPHYLFMLDRASGTLHFQTPIDKALDLIRRLRADYSGLIVPHLLVDLPGRDGKVELTPGALIEIKPHGAWLRGRDGRRVFYAN